MSIGGRPEGDRRDGSRLAHQKYQHTPTAQCTPTIVNPWDGMGWDILWVRCKG